MNMKAYKIEYNNRTVVVPTRKKVEEHKKKNPRARVTVIKI